MDTFTLQYILDNIFPSLNGIVCARDQLLTINKKRNCYIVNTDPISKAGQHWVLIYYTPNNTCYYFDSYGSHNRIEIDISNFISINCLKLFRNKYRFQSDSSQLCGIYCLYVLYAMLCYNHSFSYIVHNNFNFNNWLSNDMLLTMWFRHFYKHLNMKTSGNNVTCQTCASRM